jgi:sulfatase modifying factor 1
MVWVPPGTLHVGTPPGRVPRIADQEMPGTPIELKGFFIDRYSYPGEQGAIPETGFSFAEASAICEKQGKRLCTELEWERACKGPSNQTYEYGDEFDAGICGMDSIDALAPNGINARCESAFGVRDLHGSAWTWTSSPWGRGTESKKVVVRGGFGKNAALIGRCAHARAMNPKERDASVGIRCCAGEMNTAEVTLEVVRQAELTFQRPTPEMAERFAELAPDELKGGNDDGRLKVERAWTWHPLGNEELHLGGGCARRPGTSPCGIVIARRVGERLERLAWVSSDDWIATVGRYENSRGIYIYGGDALGAYRKAVMFDWGMVSEGRKERKKGSGWVRPVE